MIDVFTPFLIISNAIINIYTFEPYLQKIQASTVVNLTSDFSFYEKWDSLYHIRG